MKGEIFVLFTFVGKSLSEWSPHLRFECTCVSDVGESEEGRVVENV